MAGGNDMPGLITRIGLWIDNRWEDKATVRELDSLGLRMEEKGEALAEGTRKVLKEMGGALDLFKADLKMVIEARNGDGLNKELTDLKSRIEKIELYAGMTRKVDPTKPAVAKSAFTM